MDITVAGCRSNHPNTLMILLSGLLRTNTEHREDTEIHRNTQRFFKSSCVILCATLYNLISIYINLIRKEPHRVSDSVMP